MNFSVRCRGPLLEDPLHFGWSEILMAVVETSEEPQKKWHRRGDHAQPIDFDEKRSRSNRCHEGRKRYRMELHVTILKPCNKIFIGQCLMRNRSSPRDMQAVINFQSQGEHGGE